MRRHLITPLVGAFLAVVVPATTQAEESPATVPVLGVHLVPSMSVVLPSEGSEAITSPYGIVHPAGAVGVSFHFNDRFALVLDFEAEGMSGQLRYQSSEPIDVRFVSYWTHLRGRTRIGTVGPVSFLVDASVGMLFSREDAWGFRAEGTGVSFGLGPVVSVALGRNISLSLGMLLEGGWAFYDVLSPQASEGDTEYTLAWPRILFGLGLDGLVIHRPRRRAAPPAEEPPPPTVEEPPAPTAEEPTEPAAPAFAAPPPEGGAETDSTEGQLDQPW